MLQNGLVIVGHDELGIRGQLLGRSRRAVDGRYITPMTDNISNLIDAYTKCRLTVSDLSNAGLGIVFPRNKFSSLWKSGAGADWRGLHGYNVRSSPYLKKFWARSIGALMRVVYQHLHFVTSFG